MEVNHKGSSSKKEEEEEEAIIKMWKYIFGFSEMAAIKCAIDLKIADTIEANGSPMTLTQLSTTLNCSSQLLYRILRFLVHRGFFKQQSISTIAADNSTTITYAQTPLSRLVTASNADNMAPFLLLESSPVMVAPWLNLSLHVKNVDDNFPFEVANGKDIWSYAAENPIHSGLINEAMGCCGGMVASAILETCGDIFDGVQTLVDVGGGNGTILGIFLKICPWIKRAINFDLPHVVSTLPVCANVEHVAGNMFDFVPNADVVFLKWVLHDWNDEECINILKNCKKAIPKEKGKVIIVEAVIDEGKQEINKWSDVGLMLDLVMMAHTKKGKERTFEEWAYVINSAGFTTFTVTHIPAIQSLIQCFP